MTSRLRLALLACSLSVAPAALAIHVEPNVAGFESPVLGIAAAAVGEDEAMTGDAAPALTSAFTSINGQGMKRKPFPPGYSRSGYSFADEDVGAPPSPLPSSAPQLPAASAHDASKPPADPMR